MSCGVPSIFLGRNFMHGSSHPIGSSQEDMMILEIIIICNNCTVHRLTTPYHTYAYTYIVYGPEPLYVCGIYIYIKLTTVSESSLYCPSCRRKCRRQRTVHSYIHVYTYTHMYTYMHSCITHTHTHTHTHTNTNTHTYTHTHTHTHMYMYTSEAYNGDDETKECFTGMGV